MFRVTLEFTPMGGEEFDVRFHIPQGIPHKKVHEGLLLFALKLGQAIIPDAQPLIVMPEVADMPMINGR